MLNQMLFLCWSVGFEIDLQDFTELVGVHDLLNDPTIELVPVWEDPVFKAMFDECFEGDADAGRRVNALRAAATAGLNQGVGHNRAFELLEP